MDLLIDNKKTLPPNAEKLDVLNPYAVLLRYDFIDKAGDDASEAELVAGQSPGSAERLTQGET